MTKYFLQKASSLFTVFAVCAVMIPGSALASSLPPPTNLTLVGGVYTNDTTPTFTWTRPQGATWYEFAIDNGGWQGITNVSSYTTSPLANGWHGFFLRARDGEGHISTSVSLTFEIDTIGPTVSTVSPNTAVEGESTTFIVSTSGEAATMFCDMYVNGSNAGNMTKYGTTFKKSYTFSWDGTYSVYARCVDGDDNTTTGPSRTVTVSNQDEPTPYETFWVNDVSPTTAREDEPTTMRVTTSGTLNADHCLLYIDGSSVGTMSETSFNHFSKSYIFTNSRSYSVYAYCEDETGNWARGTARKVSVEQDHDNETFSVPAVSPSSAIEDEEITFTVTPYGTLNAETCKLYIDGSFVGTMSDSNGTFQRDYTFLNDGNYSVYAYCQDERGDWTKGTTRTVSVSHQYDSHTSTLDVPVVTPSTANEDERTTFTVRPTSNYNVTDCSLYVDGDRVATMNEGRTNVFTATYTFKNSGSYSVYASCKDSHGTTLSGDKRTVRVYHKYGYSSDDTSDEADHGSLIKTACGTTVLVNDPCTAVYYYGNDGKRHVFPNEATYFTWYSDFDDVVEVSSDFMSSLVIGKNVTLRPGSVLVKFESSSSIYAVEKDHTLRRYTTTGLIKSDYGEDWEDVCVTISDSLYGNYTIGNVIDSTSDFDRNDEYYSVDSIDDVL